MLSNSYPGLTVLGYTQPFSAGLSSSVEFASTARLDRLRKTLEGAGMRRLRAKRVCARTAGSEGVPGESVPEQTQTEFVSGVLTQTIKPLCSFFHEGYGL